MSSPQPLSLTTIAIRRHIGTLMLTLTVIVVGLFVTLQLPVDLLPAITYPRIGLRLGAPGIAPEVAVDEITRPLEEGLSATEGVVQVFSQTREGRIGLDLFFEPGGDIDQALNDATAALNRVRDSLPDGVEEPRLFKLDPSQLPVYEMALTSPDLAAVDLRVFAEQELSRELLRVPGVANVDISGGVEEEVQVYLDLDRLQALGLEVSDVVNALAERNQDVSGGRIRGGDRESLSRIVGRFQSVDEIWDLPIEAGQGSNGLPRQVYLRDLATVVDGTEEQRVFVTLNGSPAVKVSIQKQPTANSIAVVDGIKAKLETLRESGLIAPEMVLTTTLDESGFIRNSIRNVTASGLTGALLAAIVVFLFLGSFRQTLIIVLAIPLATLGAMLLMGLSGISLNTFSLGGLALGVGIVVDNSIVMLENIAKSFQQLTQRARIQQQVDATALTLSPRQLLQQAEASSQELESALIASTTTNLVAVVPFLLIGGFVSLIFNELVLTVSFAIAVSLLVALTVVPALSARLLDPRRNSGLQDWPPIRWFQNRLEGLAYHYGRSLQWLIQRKIPVILVIVAVFGGSSFWMSGQLAQEILPRINTGQASALIQFPPGTTLGENQKIMAILEQKVLEQPETAYTFTTSGGFIFASNTTPNALRGSMTVILKPGSSVSAFADRLNGELGKLPLIDTLIRFRPETVRGLILSNSPVRGDIDLVLQGSDQQALVQAGRQYMEALKAATLSSFRPDAEQPQEEVQILPDWERVADAGLSAESLGDLIQAALDGKVATQLQRGDRLVDVRVELPQGTIQTLEQLAQLTLPTGDGRRVRLGDVATIELGRAPGEIQRINQRQVFLLNGTLSEGASLSQALEEIDRLLADVELPPGVSRLPSANGESNRELQESLQVLGGLAIFLVFVVMAVQYNSLIDPLVILCTIPLALAGGILGLYLTETAVGATVIVGAVLLVGIVVNNAIIVLELANQIRDRQGCDRTAAILQAAPQRLRPILMTTLTTVLGLFPLALGVGEGAELLQPLGIVVFSGLSLATLLTLFLIPCLYVLFHSGDRENTHPEPTNTEGFMPNLDADDEKSVISSL
ncbi:MAG: efflux RND transporter permease subunit [Prochlorothrix sp.]|nr:efflux RND transporter permease subunit [Prochlorothrix sp.]